MILDRLHRPLKDLRISVTDRCNFRCSYCMPADIFGHDYVFMSRDEILTFEEIARLARLFVRLGVTKIRLTGGEPLLRSELESLIRMLVEIDGIEDLALTTNAYSLETKAQSLKSAGLKRITISLDTLNPELLKRLAGKHLDLKRVLQGIQAAREAGLAPIKINSVIQRGVNETEIPALVRFAKANGHIIRFIEYMDVGNLNRWQRPQVVTAEEIVDAVATTVPIEPLEKNYPEEVVNRYRFLDGEGEFGVITSVSKPFCGDCSRVRLSAEGKIFTCLFATHGFDLKEALRQGATDSELLSLISTLWKKREDRYSEKRSTESRSATPKVEMYQIGG